MKTEKTRKLRKEIIEDSGPPRNRSWGPLVHGTGQQRPGPSDSEGQEEEGGGQDLASLQGQPDEGEDQERESYHESANGQRQTLSPHQESHPLDLVVDHPAGDGDGEETDETNVGEDQPDHHPDLLQESTDLVQGGQVREKVEGVHTFPKINIE